MKIILTFFVLFFSSSIVAEDISDFEIEGMSIGDSLLKYFSITEINKAYNYDHLPSSMKFRISEFYSDSFDSDLYDAFQFNYKPEDKDFIIYGIRGFIKCNNKQDCKKIFNQIGNDLSNIFQKTKKIGPNIIIHPDDKSGESKGTKIYYLFKSKGKVDLTYMDWSINSGYKDSVSIEIVSKEVRDWINNNYF